MFSFKDRTPDALKSLVVYQFTCAGCLWVNLRYIGETSRHFTTKRINLKNKEESKTKKTRRSRSVYLCQLVDKM